MQKTPSRSSSLTPISLPDSAIAAPLRHPFDLQHLPQVLAVLVLKILEQKFPEGIFSKWNIHDSTGIIYAHERDVTANLVRAESVTYLVHPFVNCNRADLAFANRVLSLYKSLNQGIDVKVLVVTMVMSSEEMLKAKELGFEVISYVIEGLIEEEQPAPPPEPAPVAVQKLMNGTTTIMPAAGSPLQRIRTRTRTGSVLWDQVLPPPQEDALPDQFSSWLEFLLACKLPLETAIDYDSRFTAEDLLLDAQLHELRDRAILKALNIRMGHQMKILQTLKRYEAHRQAKGLPPLAPSSELPINLAATSAPLLSGIRATPAPLVQPLLSAQTRTSEESSGGSASPSSASSSRPTSVATPPPQSNSSALLLAAASQFVSLPPPDSFPLPPPPPLDPPPSPPQPTDPKGIESRFALGGPLLPAPIIPPPLARGSPTRDGSPSGRSNTLRGIVAPPPPPLSASPSPPPSVLIGKVGLPPPPTPPPGAVTPPLSNSGRNLVLGSVRPVISSPLAKSESAASQTYQDDS